MIFGVKVVGNHDINVTAIATVHIVEKSCTFVVGNLKVVGALKILIWRST